MAGFSIERAGYMNRQTDMPDGLVAGARALQHGRWPPTEAELCEVNGLLDMVNQDPRFLKRLAGVSHTRLVLSATDTGREIMIVLDKSGIQLEPFTSGPFDVQIRATEEVHQAVLTGQMDADAAFLAGKVRIGGSVVTAFRIKNKFLSVLQWYLTSTSKGTAPEGSPRER